MRREKRLEPPFIRTSNFRTMTNGIETDTFKFSHYCSCECYWLCFATGVRSANNATVIVKPLREENNTGGGPVSVRGKMFRTNSRWLLFVGQASTNTCQEDLCVWKVCGERRSCIILAFSIWNDLKRFFFEVFWKKVKKKKRRSWVISNDTRENVENERSSSIDTID